MAARGVGVVALEIGPRLARRARGNLAAFPGVTVRTTSFEAWKAAAVLEPHGHLVVMSTPIVVPEDASRFWWDIQDDWFAVGAERLDPATKHPDVVDDLGSAVRTSDLFEDPVVIRHRFDVSLTAEDRP